jgi:hypothetical protein
LSDGRRRASWKPAQTGELLGAHGRGRRRHRCCSALRRLGLLQLRLCLLLFPTHGSAVRAPRRGTARKRAACCRPGSRPRCRGGCCLLAARPSVLLVGGRPGRGLRATARGPDLVVAVAAACSPPLPSGDGGLGRRTTRNAGQRRKTDRGGGGGQPWG